jgi:hypothetical protein
MKSIPISAAGAIVNTAVSIKIVEVPQIVVTAEPSHSIISGITLIVKGNSDLSGKTVNCFPGRFVVTEHFYCIHFQIELRNKNCAV